MGAKRSSRVPVIAILFTAVLVLAACGSGTKSATSPPTTGAGSGSASIPIPKTLGTGVTASTIKIGVALADWKCLAPYIQTTRVDEYKVYDAFIADINARGGIAGRKIVPVYKTFCPIVPQPALSLCTTFTEDEHVFAVMGDFVDLSGQAQPCIAKQHKTVVITIDLTKSIIASAPPGMLLTFDATQERTVSIILQLLAREHTLAGKKVAVLGEATTQQSVNSVLVPGLKKMGVNLGTTAILTIAGSDTTAAATQLQSFVEKWKTEGVNTVFLSGLQVSAQQFVPSLVKAMPGVQLIADNNTVGTYAQNLEKAGMKPNPYEGIISANGLSAHDYNNSANWKYCAAIYEKYFHEPAPDSEKVINAADGHRLDTTGAITAACTELTMFHDIGERAGSYLNNASWVDAVDTFGKIRDMQSLYASLHTGKYDADDTFALVAYDHTVGSLGNWRYLTKVEDTPGS